MNEAVLCTYREIGGCEAMKAIGVMKGGKGEGKYVD